VEKQLAAKQAGMHRRGEAADWREISYPAVKDEENAWPIWVKAINSVSSTVDCPRSTNVNYGDPPYPPGWFPVAAASEKANGQAIALARTARTRPLVQFRTRLPAPASTWLVYLNPAHGLVNVLADAAEYSHFTGDDDEAIERLTDLTLLGDALHQDDFFVSQLVAIGTLNQTCASIQWIAPGVAESGKPEARAARERRIRKLIEVLLDERLAREGMQRSIQVERLERADSYRERAKGAWWVRPLAQREILRAIEGFEVFSEAARCANFQDAREVLQRCGLAELYSYARPPGGLVGAKRVVPRYSRWFEETGVDPDSILQRLYREIGARRLAAMGLACQLYHAKWRKWPAKLEDLVPEFLPEVPKHPFYADGRRLDLTIKGGKPDGGDFTIFAAPDESAKAVDRKPDQADAPGEKSQVKKNGEKPQGKKVGDDEEGIFPCLIAHAQGPLKDAKKRQRQ